MIYIIYILAGVTIIYCLLIVWIIIGFLKIKKQDLSQTVKKSVTKISVIIAARNEEETIVNCLESLEKQHYNNDNFEVITVNDHSIDATEQVIIEYIKKSKLCIKLISLTDKTSKKEALKYGIEQAKHELIATTDADCILPNNWLQTISEHLKNGAEMLLGPIMFKKQKGFLAAFQTLDMLAIQGVEYGALAHQKAILNNAANLSYHKKAYNNVNGFDNYNTPSGDDIFLLEKFNANKQSIKGVLKRDFVVETNSENTLKKFFSQRLRWASKAKYYSDKLLLFFSAIVLFQNIVIIFIYFTMPFVEKQGRFLIILLLSKWLIDFILLFLIASFFDRRKALYYFIPVQILYPIYTVVIWVASMTVTFEWKGRKF